MDDMIAFFNAALADNRLSRSEAKALGECLRDERPAYNELNVLRARLFDLVKQKLTAQNYRELHLWLDEAVKILMRQLKPKEPEIISRCYFSPGNDCRDAILERLRAAKRSLRICVFTISDDIISREIEQAHKRQVSVEIISDNDKMEDKGSDIEQLRRAGITVYVDKTINHMHHKFAVVDEFWLINGSFNWTRSATVYNQENILVTNEPQAVKAFNEEFLRLIPQMERLY